MILPLEIRFARFRWRVYPDPAACVTEGILRSFLLSFHRPIR